MNTIISAIGAARIVGDLADAFGRVRDGAQIAVAALQAPPASRLGTAAPFTTALGLTGPGSQNLIEAEVMRRLFSFGGHVGPQNPTEAEIQRRQMTRIGGAAGRVGVQNPMEAEIFRRLVTVRVLGPS